MNKQLLTKKIKEYSTEKGFDLIGITDSRKIEDISFYNYEYCYYLHVHQGKTLFYS